MRAHLLYAWLALVCATGCRRSRETIVADDAARTERETAPPGPATLVVECSEVTYVSLFLVRDRDGAGVSDAAAAVAHQPCGTREQREVTFVVRSGLYRIEVTDLDAFRPGGNISASGVVDLAPDSHRRWIPKYVWRGGLPYPMYGPTVTPPP